MNVIGKRSTSSSIFVVRSFLQTCRPPPNLHLRSSCHQPRKTAILRQTGVSERRLVAHSHASCLETMQASPDACARLLQFDPLTENSSQLRFPETYLHNNHKRLRFRLPTPRSSCCSQMTWRSFGYVQLLRRAFWNNCAIPTSSGASSWRCPSARTTTMTTSRARGISLSFNSSSSTSRGAKMG